jgi:hypothetical protein
MVLFRATVLFEPGAPNPSQHGWVEKETSEWFNCHQIWACQPRDGKDVHRKESGNRLRSE